MNEIVTDRIEKQITLGAPRGRVWQALTDAAQFGQWFGCELNGRFVAGESIRGQITSPAYRHLKLEFHVERIEPEHYFAYRWHPFAVDPAVDYSDEVPTLVEFFLTDQADGTLLRVIESGFDALPESRRATAYRMNDGGWKQQLGHISSYVTGAR